MAIKKDIEPGMILAKRNVYGLINSYHSYDNSDYTHYKFINPAEEDLSERNFRNKPMYHSYVLRLKTRRARTQGVVIPSELAPLMRSLNIKLIPYRTRYTEWNIYRHIQFFPGKFETKYIEMMPAPRSFGGYESIPTEVTSLVPTSSFRNQNIKNQQEYYIAVGTEMEFYSSYQGFYEPDAPELLHKYEGKIENEEYRQILNSQSPYDLLKIT